MLSCASSGKWGWELWGPAGQLQVHWGYMRSSHRYIPAIARNVTVCRNKWVICKLGVGTYRMLKPWVYRGLERDGLPQPNLTTACQGASLCWGEDNKVVRKRKNLLVFSNLLTMPGSWILKHFGGKKIHKPFTNPIKRMLSNTATHCPDKEILTCDTSHNTSVTGYYDDFSP